MKCFFCGSFILLQSKDCSGNATPKACCYRKGKAHDCRQWRKKGVCFGADTGVMRANVSRTTKVSNRMVRARVIYSIFDSEPTSLHQNRRIAVVNQREPSLTAAGGRKREGAGLCRGRQFRQRRNVGYHKRTVVRDNILLQSKDCSGNASPKACCYRKGKAHDCRRWWKKGVCFGADTGVMRANESRTTKVSNRMVRA